MCGGLRVGFITYGGTFTGDTGPLYDALERKTPDAFAAPFPMPRI